MTLTPVSRVMAAQSHYQDGDQKSEIFTLYALPSDNHGPSLVVHAAPGQDLHDACMFIINTRKELHFGYTPTPDTVAQMLCGSTLYHIGDYAGDWSLSEDMLGPRPIFSLEKGGRMTNFPMLATRIILSNHYVSHLPGELNKDGVTVTWRVGYYDVLRPDYGSKETAVHRFSVTHFNMFRQMAALERDIGRLFVRRSKINRVLVQRCLPNGQRRPFDLVIERVA